MLLSNALRLNFSTNDTSLFICKGTENNESTWNIICSIASKNSSSYSLHEISKIVNIIAHK